MRLNVAPDALTLRVTAVNSDALPRPGDLQIEASFRVDTFAGTSTCWVDAAAFQVFANSLRSLYTSFQGSALLESLSPGDFSLSLNPANARGYVSISVLIRKRTATGPRAASATIEVALAVLEPLVRWADSPHVEDA
jgi:hypothetical protein